MICPSYAKSGYYFGAQFGKANTAVNSLSSTDVPSDVLSVTDTMPNQSFSSGGATANIDSFTVNSINVNSFDGSSNDRVWMGMIYVGYQMSDFLAVEMGGLTFKDTSASYNSNTTTNFNAAGTASFAGAAYSFTATGNFTQANRVDTISQYGMDVAAKIIWPINNKFDLYTKLGGAYLITKVSTVVTLQSSASSIIVTIPGLGTSAPAAAESDSTTYSATKKQFYPLLGLGASFGITDSAKINIEWYRLMASNSVNGNMDMITMGFIVGIGQS